MGELEYWKLRKALLEDCWNRRYQKANTDFTGKLDQLPLPEVLWPHQQQGVYPLTGGREKEADE